MFAWLRAPDAGAGDWLAVDSYYPRNRLVIMCRARSGPHDALYRELIPAHGLKFLALDPRRLGADRDEVESALASMLFGRPATAAAATRRRRRPPAPAPEPEPPARAAPRPDPPPPAAAPRPDPAAAAAPRPEPEPRAATRPEPPPRAAAPGSEREPTTPEPMPPPTEQMTVASEPIEATSEVAVTPVPAARPAARPATPTGPATRPVSPTGAATRPATPAGEAAQLRSAGETRAVRAEWGPVYRQHTALIQGLLQMLGVILGLAMAVGLIGELYLGLIKVAFMEDRVVLAIAIVLDTCARPLGTVAAERAGNRIWAFLCALGGSPVVAIYTLLGPSGRVKAEPAPLASVLSVLACAGAVVALLTHH
jgi:hypothetical protein